MKIVERFVIVEVGSTNTRSYLYNEERINDLGRKTIEFKNNYKKAQKIDEIDKKKLFDFINSLNEKNVFVYGTSIFRNLTENQKIEWLKEFKEKTNIDFNIVTSDMENEYTVYGAIAGTNYKGNVAVMIGGGGSTELSILKDGKIIEKANSPFGAIDVTDNFSDLKTDIATTDFDLMISETKKLVNIPKNKADILILAGGDYIYFYEELNYQIKKNNFCDNPLQPYVVDKKLMDELDQDFFYNVSLNNVCERTNDEGWWRGARGMRVCVRTLADILEAKYIIPTRINMVYGIVEELKKKK